MNETEQFEAWWRQDGTWCDNPFTSKKETSQSAFNAGKESKQAELNKANARIAQLEDALQIAHKYMNHLPTFGEDRAPVIRALKESSDTWLCEHDKAVEVRVLERVFNIEAEFGWRGVINLIESRKSK